MFQSSVRGLHHWLPWFQQPTSVDSWGKSAYK